MPVFGGCWKFFAFEFFYPGNAHRAMDNLCEENCGGGRKVIEMHAWLKSIKTRMSRPVLCMAAGAFLILPALKGLVMLVPIHCQAPQLGFFVCCLLLLFFWIGWLVFFASLNYWINSKLFP